MTRSTLALAALICLSLATAGCNCGEVAIGGHDDVSAGENPDGSLDRADTGGPADLDATSEVGDGGEDQLDAGETGDGGEEVADATVVGGDGGCPAVSCTGLCGPVRDFCTSNVLQCGGCTLPKVCDLDLHVCLMPLLTCADLGAECGEVRTTCGTRIPCPVCPDGKECDRNTHQCVACSNPTCIDLGYQCGTAWLGCGPYTNTTACGDCPTGQGCNAASNVCEAQCTPAADATICLAAGAECGYVTNGCGGLANCGTCADAAKSCGARGIANRCDFPETPDECVAANRTCGTLVSACGGAALSCGKCTGVNICWPDGHCAPPCDPKTCGSPELVGKCGTQLDDGCQGTLSCTCSTGLSCTTSAPGVVGDCINPAGCAQFNATGKSGDPCSNGPNPAWPKGDGSFLTCGCTTPAGAKCYDANHQEIPAGSPLAGTCCFNTIACGLNACNQSVTDACTLAPVPCTCGAGKHCNDAAKQCEGDYTCAAYQPSGGAAGDPCSIGTNPGFPVFAGDPTGLSCGCAGAGVCNKPGQTQLADPHTTGACCVNTNLCAAGECLTSKTDTCSGQTITCPGCGAGRHCNALHQCEQDNGCGQWTQGQVGQPCSNTPDLADFPKGDGTGLTCTCQVAGALCYDAAGKVVPDGTILGGSCCIPVACGNRCGDIPETCSNTTLHCTCGGNTHCNAGTGLCVPNLGCGDYGANGNWYPSHVPPDGDLCSNGPAFSNGSIPPTQALLTCACNGGALCSNGAAVVPGTGCGTAGSTSCAIDGDCGSGNKCVNNLCATPCPTGHCCQNTAACGNQCNITLTNTCTGVAMAPCVCAAGYYCSSTVGPGTCLQDHNCGFYLATGANGAPCTTPPNANPAWPRNPSDSVGLACGCGGTRVCSVAGTPPHVAGTGEVGVCCTSGNPCAGLCDQTVTDPSTGLPLTCSCSGTNYCDTGTDTCKAYLTCLSYTANGLLGQACSKNNDPTDFPRWPPSFPPADAVGRTCACNAGLICSNGGVEVVGAQGGHCCQPTVVPAGNVGDDCTDVTDPCTGLAVHRPCKPANNCDVGTGKCVVNWDCAHWSANGAPGQVCSNGNDPTDFGRYPGDTTGLTCHCTAGNCYNGAKQVVTGGAGGTCCTSPTCPANTCATITDPCTGLPITCSCSGGYHCSANACVADRACSFYNANHAVGDPCSDGPNTAFHDGPGGINLTCNCSTAAPYQNDACVGWTPPSTTGTCTCSPQTPANCSNNGQSDRCGGTMVSTCLPTQVCYQSACCDKLVCPAGNDGDVCGSISQCGIVNTCPCTQQYMTCGAVTAGVCGCLPKTLADCPTLGKGTWPDGCGGYVTCVG